MNKIKKLEEEIEGLRQEKQMLLNELYNLGLAPHEGYYEAKLKDIHGKMSLTETFE